MATNDSKRQAIWTLIQTVVTAILLAIQTIFFGGCVSAGGDVTQTNDVQITVPSFRNLLDSLRSSEDSLSISFQEFEELDDMLLAIRQELARQYYAQSGPPSQPSTGLVDSTYRSRE